MLLLTQMLFGQIIIDSDQTWNTDHICNEDVIIKSGVTLTIEYPATMSMGEGVKILIESGAKLKVNGVNFNYINATNDENSNIKWEGIEMEDGSSLEILACDLYNANNAIELTGDGDIELTGNVYFWYDNTGMRLNLLDSGGNSNIFVGIYCSFVGCNEGIVCFGNFEKFDIGEYDNNFYGCENAIELSKEWNDDNGHNVNISNVSFHGCETGIECIYAGANVSNCTFEGGEVGIWLEDAAASELVHNDFEDCTNGGVISYGGNFFMHDENRFYNCNTGVLAMDAYSNSDFKIVDQNYFGACGTAIDVSGIDYGRGFEIRDNILEYNEFAIFAQGSNKFNVESNELYTNDFNINIGRSGDYENKIGCNEISNSWNGLQIHYDNEMTSFIGNDFLDLSDMDVILRSATINLNIGDKDYPAMNSFGSNSEDIKNWNTDEFTYWIPKNAPDNLDPDGIPDDWKDESYYSTNGECGLPYDTPVDVNNETVKEWKEQFCYYWNVYRYHPDNKLFKEMYYKYKRLLGRYYTNYYAKAEGVDIMWDIIISYLKNVCDHYYFQKRLYSVYLKTGDCFRADSVLNAIELSLAEPVLHNRVDSLDREMKRSFVNIQRIVSRYTCAKRDDSQRASFEFSQDEINTLYQEAQKTLPESGYARALYFIATKDLLPNVDYVMPEEQTAQQASSSKDVIDANTFNVYPNPAKEMIFVEYNVEHNINAKLKMYDIYGKKMIEKTVVLNSNNTLNLDVSNFKTGVYMLTITDDTGNVLKNEKILIESINR